MRLMPWVSLTSVKQLLTLVLLLAAPACRPPRNANAEWVPSPNYSARRPQMVILHHTSEKSFEAALEVLQTRNGGGQVSSHYLLGKTGRLAQLVSEDHRAWHAGSGTWGSFRDLNSLSIGIELDNDGLEPFPPKQIEALLHLLKDITQRHRIPRALVLGHGDVDPVRKVDPHSHFPWKLLAEHGFGLWPDPELKEPPAGFEPWAAIRHLGYSTKDPEATLRAFHRHYRTGPGTGFDAEDCRILYNLQQKQKNRAPY
ncbi:N-acetylmuramoyl-L-alanine amidase [bacterium]|nr:N-acetylmuramoyl-L-alanine amidase [bacterium]